MRVSWQPVTLTLVARRVHRRYQRQLSDTASGCRLGFELIPSAFRLRVAADECAVGSLRKIVAAERASVPVVRYYRVILMP